MHKVLDCTLRDGGYYNNWDFSQELVDAYLSAASEAKIDYIELGLRNFPKAGFLGAYAYTTEEHINSFELPEGPTYGVMIDAKTILNAVLEPEEAVDKLFVPASESKLGLVRVAAHFHEVESAGPLVKRLKELGYIVGLNLMQAGGKPTELIAEKARIATSWDMLDVLYFADSLGNMDGAEVERVVQALRQEWLGPLGIHSHNNMGKALDNTVTAWSAGVTWLDATITGMGRGAGNTQTEYLLALMDKNNSKYYSKPIYDLVIRSFESMQKSYGWGSNLLYFLGAQNDVHPTYIQNLLSSSHYGTSEVVGAIEYLSKIEGTDSYNGSVLENAIIFNVSQKEVSGSIDLIEKFKDKAVLVLVNGESTSKYKKAIELYIRVKKPIVLSVNLNETIPQDLIDYVIISHNVKFLSDMEKYRTITKPIILPKHRFSDEELLKISHLPLIDYGFEITETFFSTNETYVSSPYNLTSAYLMGILETAQPESVSLVGFDGYEKGDVRQQEMVDIINHYNAKSNVSKLVAITPSSYPIEHGSLYAIHS